MNVQVGDVVWDDLTSTTVKVVRVETDKHGNVGIWVDSTYLEGARHPWEVSPTVTEETEA